MRPHGAGITPRKTNRIRTRTRGRDRKVGAGKDHVGFISRVGLDGRIEELEWVTGLDGPCGMGLHEDTLYVAECSGYLLAIDTPTGTIRERYPAPGAQFLNDVSAAPDGRVFVSNSSRPF